jgi:hypothetical protein
VIIELLKKLYSAQKNREKNIQQNEFRYKSHEEVKRKLEVEEIIVGVTLKSTMVSALHQHTDTHVKETAV